MTKTRKFKGYAALNRRGDLIWGTLTTKPEWTREKFDSFNPDPTTEGQGESIVEVTILLKT